MADRRKTTPVRFLKRNRLYITAALVLVLLAAAAIAVISQVRSLSPAKNQEQQTAQTEQTVKAPEPAQSPESKPDAAEEPADESVYKPPFEGKTVLIAGGKLVLTFDETALTMSENDGLLSLTDKDGARKSRLDVQEIGADLALFKTSELERICIGVIQAYYHLAPETKDFTVTDVVSEDGCFTATVTAPEYDTESEVTARVGLWKLDGKSYCVSAVSPGEDGEAVFQAFSSIEPLGEKHLAEAAQ